MSENEMLLGERELVEKVRSLELGADTFKTPHASDDNPFRIFPSGIRFKGYEHDDSCPTCGTRGDEKGTVQDYIGGVAGGYLAVYLCKSCLFVWVASFGYSRDTEYPEGHVHHPDNRIA
jgi:rubredoxin